MRRVILESPYAGDIEKNIEYARRCAGKHRSPAICSTPSPDLNDNDPAEREQGIQAGLAWGENADATVVYIDHGVSSGMQYGVDRAKKAGRPVEIRSIGK